MVYYTLWIFFHGILRRRITFISSLASSKGDAKQWQGVRKAYLITLLKQTVTLDPEVHTKTILGCIKNKQTKIISEKCIKTRTCSPSLSACIVYNVQRRGKAQKIACPIAKWIMHFFPHLHFIAFALRVSLYMRPELPGGIRIKEEAKLSTPCFARETFLRRQNSPSTFSAALFLGPNWILVVCSTKFFQLYGTHSEKLRESLAT
jgi:hypothetical protein